ncbi:cupin [Chloroflexus islandicus]|uniref:Cupin n=1 Tax=Chloroflexus islandicus TaxID=1707952 RepID=A0A178MG37_9CHLR|nr:cupin domain-containing protein [Chloroflexus islandicus]OAN47669.1 cupin [Chloroflexus islandicus]
MSERPWIELFPGVFRRRIALTGRMYQMAVRLEEGSHVPLHSHPEDQVAYVVSGRLRFQLGDELIEAAAGSSIAIPGGTPHAVWTLEETLAIDTFSPPRADYLAADGDR